MLIVADTSPLNYLILIGVIDLLPAIYNEICVPEAIITELCDPGAPLAVRAWAKTPPAWLKILPTPQPLPDFKLDWGESAVIQLAITLKADRVLIDEALGRQVATGHGLNVLGTLGVLVAAARLGLIDLKTGLSQIGRAHV